MMKACLVAYGDNMVTPSSITYSSVVSKDSVSIAFLIASLNYLDICACDIKKFYLDVKCRERLWVVVGTDFDTSERGSVMIIARYLYGLKYSGAA